MDAIYASVISGLFGLLTVIVGSFAAVWAHQARKVGRSNARELSIMTQRLDSRQDKMITTAVKQYVAENPGMIDSAVAHEAMRDLLFELVALHLSPEEVEVMRHDKQRRTGDR